MDGAGTAAAGAATRRFLPAVARRTPAAAQRAVAHSALHPLLQLAAKKSDLSLSELSEVCGPTYLHPKPPGGHYFPVWTPHDRRRKAAVKDDGSDDAADAASDGPTPTAPRTRRA